MCQDSHDPDKNRVMTVQEFYEFLLPNEKKGPALCLSSIDFAKNKTAIEQLCAQLKDRCTIEMKREIQMVDKNVTTLQKRTRQ